MKKILLPLVLSVSALIFGFSQEIHAEETDTNQLTSVEQIKKYLILHMLIFQVLSKLEKKVNLFVIRNGSV